MGHVRVRATIAHPYRRDEGVEVHDALVDTGATLTTLPRAVADGLGLDVVGRKRARTMTGVVEIDRSFAWIEVQGKDGFVEVSVSDTFEGVLIGVTTLETLGLAVDPVSERLIDAELLLL
jgi:aspartyl protease family protein